MNTRRLDEESCASSSMNSLFSLPSRGEDLVSCLTSLLRSPLHLQTQPLALPEKGKKVSRTHRSQELDLLLAPFPFRHPSPRVIRSSSGEKRKSSCVFSSGSGRLFFFFYISVCSVSFLSLPLSLQVAPLSPVSLLYPSLSHSLSVSLALGSGVCGCAGGQHESCGSQRAVRESDGRRDSSPPHHG